MALQRHDGRGEAERGAVPAAAAAHLSRGDPQRRVDVAHHPPAQRPAPGRRHGRRLAHRGPRQAQPGRVQGMRQPGRLQAQPSKRIYGFHSFSIFDTDRF